MAKKAPEILAPAAAVLLAELRRAAEASGDARLQAAVAAADGARTGRPAIDDTAALAEIRGLLGESPAPSIREACREVAARAVGHSAESTANRLRKKLAGPKVKGQANAQGVC